MTAKRRPFEELIRLERENILARHGLFPRSSQAWVNGGGNSNGHHSHSNGGAAGITRSPARKDILPGGRGDDETPPGGRAEREAPSASVSATTETCPTCGGGGTIAAKTTFPSVEEASGDVQPNRYPQFPDWLPPPPVVSTQDGVWTERTRIGTSATLNNGRAEKEFPTARWSVVSVGGFAPELIRAERDFFRPVFAQADGCDCAAYQKYIDRAVALLASCPLTKRLHDVVAAKFRGRLEFVCIPDTSPFKSHWDFHGRSIELRCGLGAIDLVQSIVFELINAYHNDDFQQVDAEASAGRLSRDEYARRMEEIEYKTYTKYIAVMRWGIANCKWSRRMDELNGANVPSFDDFRKAQNAPTDPQDPDSSHTGFHRTQWDEFYRQAYERRRRAQSPPSGGEEFFAELGNTRAAKEVFT
ncbi:MAG: hypothetical protein HY719_12165 [Planctomycetes bacterium]|nr:hypothetical protein [Planctomycetota bacterium]